jgi:hypothetical protein
MISNDLANPACESGPINGFFNIRLLNVVPIQSNCQPYAPIYGTGDDRLH